MGINIRFLAYIGIMILLICLIFPHATYNLIATPFKEQNKTINETPIIIIYKNITVFVTPTPDGKRYFAGEYQTGTRLLYRPFTFTRENASGFKDLSVTTRIYDYKIFNKLHVFNPTTYKYELIYPRSDTKFLFIFVNTYLNDIVGDDSRFWSMDKKMFAAQIGNLLFYPSEYTEHLRIKELEETFTYDNSIAVESYRQKRLYSASSEYRQSAGEYSDKLGWLRGGISNAIDGYILFEIPKDTKTEDILILGNFYTFGNANWVLKTE